MSKTFLGKYKWPSKNSKLYKKVKKEYIQETISLLSLPVNSDATVFSYINILLAIFNF